MPAGRLAQSSRRPPTIGIERRRSCRTGREASGTRTATATAAASRHIAAEASAAGAAPDAAMIRPAARGPTNVPRLSPSAPAVFALTSSDGLAATAGSSVRTVGRTSGAGRRGERDRREHQQRGVGEAGRRDEQPRPRRARRWRRSSARSGRRSAPVSTSRFDGHRRDHPGQRDEAHQHGAARLVGDEQGDHEERPVRGHAQGPARLERADVAIAQDAGERSGGEGERAGGGRRRPARPASGRFEHRAGPGLDHAAERRQGDRAIAQHGVVEAADVEPVAEGRLRPRSRRREQLELAQSCRRAPGPASRCSGRPRSRCCWARGPCARP